ncbi:MAG: FMN-binding negative transcriptional regulator [Bryobacteraceae bacterium]
MYNPSHFAENRLDVLHNFIRQHPLSVLVTCGPGGLEATHVPMVLHPKIGSQGALRCHLARANSQWKTIDSQTPVLAIFSGPEHYITPSWYAAKKEHGRVVPTWNYVAVHASGGARLFEEEAELFEHLNELTSQSEAPFEKPWAVEDAPQEFVKAMAKAIVGIEIFIDRLEGKWKANQNRSHADRQGVIEGLESLQSPRSLEMAEIVRRCER